MTWAVAGYRAEEIVGFGASGEVWRGVSESSGDAVALKRLRVGSAPADRQRLRREAALLASLQHPHLLRFRELVEQDTEVVLVLDLAEGGSLGALVARRGQLLPGEVVTALAPVADALATAHAHGIVHGDVSPGNVLLTRDGRPLLADLGTARLVGEGGGAHSTAGFTDPALARGLEPTTASDVYALAAIAVQALTGALPGAPFGALPGALPTEDGVRAALDAAGVPPALEDILLRCLDPQQARRPSAAAVGRTLLSACPPLPLRTLPSGPMVSPAALTHVVPGGGDAVVDGAVERPPWPRRLLIGTAARLGLRRAGSGGRHRSDGGIGARRPRGVTTRIVLAVFLVGIAAVVGVGWGAVVTPDHPARIPAASGLSAGPEVPGGAPRTPTAWATVLDGLDATRSTAFATADTASLRRVYASGCAALRRDEASLRALRTEHAHASGVRHRVLAVSVVRASSSSAELRVDDEMTGYAVVDPSGRVVQRTAARGRRSMLVSLVQTTDGWRISGLTLA